EAAPGTHRKRGQRTAPLSSDVAKPWRSRSGLGHGAGRGRGGSSFLDSGLSFTRGFFGRFLGVRGQVLAGGQHQIDGVHLHFLGDFGKGSHMLGSHFGGGGGEIAYRFGIFGRLFLGRGQLTHAGDGVLGPLGRDLGRTLGGGQRN